MGQNIGVIELGDEDFRRFREIIYRESGINMTDMKKALVQARLLRRLRELRLPDYRAYHDYLADHYAEEIVNLINCVTTNKTEFFRENNHFLFLREVFLPAFDRTGGKRLRIWSSACSTGEEAYSIAMTLLEHYAGRTAPDMKILASDIDTRVLETAAAGVYREDTSGGLDPELLRRYFLKGRGADAGRIRVRDQVRGLIAFRRLNLLDERWPMRNPFDVIFCRNVVIYFDKPTQHRLFAHLHRHLADDGYLFVGHSETLTGLTDLYRFRASSIYAKATGAAAPHS